MIRTETVTIGEKQFIHTWSDVGADLKQDGTGNIYSDAMDLVEYPKTYTEIEKPDEEISDSEALAIITGRTEG